jgi:hypothetical protein
MALAKLTGYTQMGLLAVTVSGNSQLIQVFIIALLSPPYPSPPKKKNFGGVIQNTRFTRFSIEIQLPQTLVLPRGFPQFAGDKIFPILGMDAPAVYEQSVAQNKFGYGMGIWFLGNAINNSLMSTGAFEIYYDGNLV